MKTKSKNESLKQPTEMTQAEWLEEGKRRFGPDMMKWAFICPACGHVATVQDWKDAGASEGQVGFSCIGRNLPREQVREAFSSKGKGPCNYAGGGLLRINPIKITATNGTVHTYFAFADLPQMADAQVG
jgi:hypothetical protein